MNRRSFLRNSGLGFAAGFAPLGLTSATLKLDPLELDRISSPESEGDETFWSEVRRNFEQSPEFINLENGYFSPQTTEGYKKFSGYGQELNRSTSFIMRTQLEQEQEMTRKALAEAWECSPDELVVTRNTTEALNTVIMGYPFKSGDEAVIADQDYPNMIQAFEQREKRDKVVLKRVKIPFDPKNDEEIVSLYRNAITKQTKVILLTHMINYTGQVLPVRKIADMAHRKGVEVIVDAAHSFAHIDFKMYDLGADYLGTSLHKCLLAPLGTGLLFIRKEKISKIWPLMGDSEAGEYDIRKFERVGTLPLGTRKGIRDAIDFHKKLGGSNKEKRLRSLTTSWIESVQEYPNITINSPNDEMRRGAIGNISLKGKKPMDVSMLLYKQYKIFTVPIDKPFLQGIRVTPHLYNTPDDINQFVKVIGALSD